jgi:hypothetical protein
MGAARKITVEVPPELLKKVQQASGTGVTQTIRAGLEFNGRIGNLPAARAAR